MLTCEICNYNSQWKSHLSRHLKSKKHANNVEIQKRKDEEAREQRKHFVCDKCGKRFAKSQGLERHTNRVKSCAEIVEVPETKNAGNTVNNNTFNIVYAPAMTERLYRDTTYDHITVETLHGVMLEYRRGDIKNKRENEIRARYAALAKLLKETHWNLSVPENRNLLVLCVMPWLDFKTLCEVFVMDIDPHNMPTWRGIDTTEFNTLMVSMLRTIQEKAQFDLTEMINFVSETLNDEYIGIINKVFAEAYYKYMGEREHIDKRKPRMKIIQKNGLI